MPHPKMLRSNVACAILFIVSALVQHAHNLNLADLETLGFQCEQLEERYSCDARRSDNRVCECDGYCHLYGDCCFDAPQNLGSIRRHSERMTCVLVEEELRGQDEGGVYAISSCPDDWTGSSEIRQNCEGPLDLNDPLNAAPVASAAQGVTYRNRYCAQCNQAGMENLTTFQLKTSCDPSDSLTDEHLYKDLKYDRSRGEWGIDRISPRNTTEFHRCSVSFQVPRFLVNSTRFCFPNLISSCPRNYSRQRIEAACKTYTAVAYGPGGERYRNPHCALCNGRTLNDLNCVLHSRTRRLSLAPGFYPTAFPRHPYMPVPLPLPECPSHERYDPFFRRCRPLLCILPGFIVVNGKCVRQLDRKAIPAMKT